MFLYCASDLLTNNVSNTRQNARQKSVLCIQRSYRKCLKTTRNAGFFWYCASDCFTKIGKKTMRLTKIKRSVRRRQTLDFSDSFEASPRNYNHDDDNYHYH